MSDRSASAGSDGAEVAVGFADDLDPAAAAAAAAARAGEGLGGSVDLCVTFAAGEYVPEAGAVLGAVQRELRPRALIGCGAGGIVSTGRELESGRGAVVWAASFPGAELHTFHARGRPGSAPAEIEGLPGSEVAADALLTFADPHSFAAAAMLERLNADRPGTPVLGGLASAAIAGDACLLLDSELASEGAVGCALSGVEVIPCVSQGATPVGPEMAVTAAEGNVIAELASKPALERLREVIAGLTDEQREGAGSGALIGIVIDENRPEHERGDFLVRPILGADRETGAIAIGERVRVGQTVRLQIRDEASADADLREALAGPARALGVDGAAGALLFTCNARGSNMFAVGDHDAGAIDDEIAVPVGGLFCAGEIGPVAGRNFLHGYTATVALFGRRSAA